MSPLFFWALVIVLTLLLGALLPKIVNVVFRIVLYVVAFCLVLWFLSYAGLVPTSWEMRVKGFLKDSESQVIETRKNHC